MRITCIQYINGDTTLYNNIPSYNTILSVIFNLQIKYDNVDENNDDIRRTPLEEKAPISEESLNARAEVVNYR